MSESDYGIPDSCEVCRPAYVLARYEVWTEIVDPAQVIDLGEEGPQCIRQLLCAPCTAEHRLREIQEAELNLVMIRTWDPLSWLD